MSTLTKHKLYRRVKNQIFNYLFIVSLLSVLFCSCSGEDINVVDIITDPNLTDTVRLESVVEVTDAFDNEEVFNGLYVSCTTRQVFNNLFIDGHFLAFGPSLRIEDSEGVYEDSLFVINWTTPNDELDVGNFLAEGFLIGPSGEEDIQFYKLTITELTLFTIIGSFTSTDAVGNERTGEFSLFRFPCESFELGEPDNFLTYTDGRITVMETGTEDEIDLSYAQLCPDIFEDQGELTRIIFGGGRQLISVDGSLEIEEVPEFFIILDNDDAYELNVPLRGYLHRDTNLFVLPPLLYSSLIGSEIAVNVLITSDDNGYLEGVFFDDSRQLSGRFRSRIIAC